MDATCLHESGDGGEKSEVAVSKHLNAKDADADSARRLRIAAERIDLASDPRPSHQILGQQDHRNHDNDRQSDLDDSGGRGETQESDAARPPVGQVVDLLRIGEIDQQRVIDAGSGDRDDDRDNAQIVCEQSIDAAERHSENRRERERRRGRIAELSDEVGRDILRRGGRRGE